MEGQLRLGTSPALGTTTGMVLEPCTVPEPIGSPLPPRGDPSPTTGLLPVDLRWLPLDLGTGLHHLLRNAAAAGG